MIYDIIAILNLSFCAFCIYIILLILSLVKKKHYTPPNVRKRYIIKLYALIALPSISIGAISELMVQGAHRDGLLTLFITLGCLAMTINAIQILNIAREREISIVDNVITEDTISN